MDFKRCYGCMRELETPGAVCPQCGFDNTNDPAKQPSHVLPCGTILNGQYMVGRSLGQGGFGITYIGYDLNLEIPVCIKEYYPEGAASRSANQSRMVYWGTSENAQGMKESRRDFVKEAQKAVKLRDLSHVVTVWGVFYENETAYIVMDYIKGETLKNRLVRTQKTLGERECAELLTPIMEDLEAAHARGIIHRDIKPENIMLAENGKPMLLDMGAAKDLGKKDGTSSTVAAVSYGFSPKEQYRKKGNIGPWTDVYAMCATIYYCVSGRVPTDALDREDGEEIDLRAFSPAVAQVLEKGLALRVEDRIQSMGELIAALRDPKPDEREQTYQAAKKYLEHGDAPELISALRMFTSLGSYRDAAEQAESCKKRLEQMKQRSEEEQKGDKGRKEEANIKTGGKNSGEKKPLPKLVIPIVAGALVLGAGGYYIGMRGYGPNEPSSSPPQMVEELETPISSAAPISDAGNTLSPAPESPSPAPESPSPAPESPSPAPESPSPAPAIPTPNGEPLSKGKTETGLSYEVFADCVRISDCDESVVEAVIPAEIEGKPVTSIGDKAFCVDIIYADRVGPNGWEYLTVKNGPYALTTVTIPDSVISIGNSAFLECDALTTVTIPDSVISIGNSAFLECDALTTVTIPDSVTSIGYDAFYKCESLTSVTIPDSVTSIGERAFSYCSALTSVTIPDSVTSIGERAFESCKSLTSVTIPDSVTSIGERAFSSCSALTSVTIPDSVTSIGERAFSSCSALTSIAVGEKNNSYCVRDNVLYTKNMKTLVAYPAGRRDKSFAIPASVTSIGDSAFESCKSLTSVTIPDSVTSIGERAFMYCSALTSVTIPDSVTSIGEMAFWGCESLTSMTIPDSVTSIGDDAFSFCRYLRSVTIPDSVTSIGERAFSSCSALKDIYYGGTKVQWEKLGISKYNWKLATIHYAK